MILASSALAADELPSSSDVRGEDLTASVRLERDRPLEELLARADALLRENKPRDAIPLLDEVLAQPAAGLVFIDGTYRDASAEANRRLALLAQIDLDRYERLAGDAARAAIQQAERSGDIDAVKRLLVRYRHTTAGRRGLRNLAQSLCDQGRFEESVLACATLIDESPVPAEHLARDPELALVWCAAAIRADNLALARGVRSRFAKVVDESPVAAQIDDLLSASGAATDDVPEAATLPENLSSAILPPVWSITTPSAGDAELQSSLAYLSSNSIPAVGALLPVVTPRGIACRTWDGVVMIDPRSGAQLWTHSTPPFTNPDARAIDGPLRRTLGDSAHLTLAADDVHVYSVVPPANQPPLAEPSPLQNELLALRLDDGEVAWRLPRADENSDSAGVPTYFRGPPTVCGAQLLVVAERDATIRMLTVERASGRVLTDVPLCSTVIGMVRDDRRLAQACPISVAGNLAICTTGGGAVVAVDRMSGFVRWAFRYPRERLPSLPQDVSPHTQPPQYLWADGWRIPMLAADEQHVVVATCESQDCRVLEAATGRQLWSLPRGDGLYVAAITKDRMIVAGRRELRAYAIADGRLEWSAPVGPIGGRGLVTLTHYVVPLSDGCMAAAELQTGEVVRTWPQQAGGLPSELASERQVIEPVSLSWAVDGIVAQSLSRIWRPQTMAAARGVAADPVTSTAERAQLLAESGETVDAVKTVRDALHALDEPEQAAIDEAVDRIADHSRQLLRMSEEPAQLDDAYLYGLVGTGHWLRDERRQLALHWEWLSRTAGSDYEFSEIARTISPLHSERHYVSTSDGAGRVRIDRAVQAKLLELRERLEPAERPAFDARFDTWDNAEGDSTFAELQIGVPTTDDPRLTDLFDHLPFGQQLRLKQPQRWTSAAEFITTQLRLLEQSRIADPSLAAAALSSLLQLYIEHSDPDDAAGVAQRLRDEFAETTLPDGTTVAAIVDAAAGNPAIARLISPADEWPDVAPTIASRPWPEGEIYFVPVTVQHAGGGLFDRLNVAVHRQGRIVRFSGAGMPRPWALTLPDSRNPLRYSQSYPDLRRAWGFGQFLVLQVGAEVFGISPLNAAGEPRAAIVWPESGASLSTTSEVGARQAIETGPALDLRVAPFDEGVERRNEFGHLVGRVGPVRTGYFCVQREGVVIAFDTATGIELWEQRDLSPGVRCYGDDRIVIVHDPGHGRFTRWNALDGRPLDAEPLIAPPHNWLSIHGCSALIEQPVQPGTAGGNYELSSFDLSTNAESWRRTLPPRTIAFPVDHRWCGVLSTDGTLQFLKLTDGTTVAQHSLTVPQPLIHVRSIIDAQRIIVIVSGMRDDDGLEAATRGGGVHTNENYRRLIVNGEWSAFDRTTGNHLWTQPLENASLLLDQPVDVPLLVCNEQRVPASGNVGAFVGRVRVFDRRHGRQLLDEASSGIHNYFVVERDVDAGWVELRLPGRVVRFDYSGADGQGP
ncbi:MAG: PQQ-binding-like beta-propeller repeat protein [Planctomycetaceae bacterium]|nr:PQQ-binding-like beta-propeller repeat protein [Planctomycetaceae bacterium]